MISEAHAEIAENAEENRSIHALSACSAPPRATPDRPRQPWRRNRKKSVPRPRKEKNPHIRERGDEDRRGERQIHLRGSQAQRNQRAGAAATNMLMAMAGPRISPSIQSWVNSPPRLPPQGRLPLRCQSRQALLKYFFALAQVNSPGKTADDDRRGLRRRLPPCRPRWAWGPQAGGPAQWSHEQPTTDEATNLSRVDQQPRKRRATTPAAA